MREVIHENGWGTGVTVAQPEIHFLVEPYGCGYHNLHVTHEFPTEDNWWSDKTVLRHGLSMGEAKKMIDMIVGQRGAHQFFCWGDRYKRYGPLHLEDY